MLMQLSPMIPVANLDRSITFFTETLGFTVTFKMDGYAFLQRDAVALRLIYAGDNVDTHDPARQQACYIDVQGIDELYRGLQTELEALPEGRVRAPFDTNYGQREFHVIDEDSLCIYFGEAIGK